MSNPNAAASRDKRSQENYYGRRLRRAAAIGGRAGRFSFYQWFKQLFRQDAPCTQLAVIQAPQESTIIQPDDMLPLLGGFAEPFSLEIYKDREEQIQFQIGFHDQDAECVANLRAQFGSHLNTEILSLESWNGASGLSDESLLSYLLPVSSLYPLSFALKWDEADVVALLQEKMKTFSSGPFLAQLLVRPQADSGQGMATDILAALSSLGRLMEPFRQGLVKQRFSQPLALFALRLLGQDELTVTALTRSLSVLNAPFNHFQPVPLKGKKAKKTAQAVLERRQGLSDGLSLISLPELAGLWHLPLAPDYRIERALVREVATARMDRTEEPGRVLGYHTLRGKTYPVILPYSARNNHFCTFGKSQSGKSTALVRIAAGDITSGLGLALIDQHDLPLRVLPHIPSERWNDVILISPRLMATQGRMFPLNLFDLGRKDAFAVEFVCETLKEILGRAFTAESIGPRTSYILDIATTALLQDPSPAATYTVLDLARVILSKEFRSELAGRLADEDTREKLLGFDKLPKDSFAAPLNKLQVFSRSSIRPMIAAKENGFNSFRGNRKSLLDAKPIVICDLADIPHASAVVIGSIVLALLQLEAFRRNPQEKNDIFHCYVDEAGAFLNLENADLITRTLTETAKFRMSLGLINQSYETIPPTVRKILSTNVAALMYFAMGIGSGDAKTARAELHDEFTEEELNRLPVGRAAVRLNGEVFSVYSPDFKTPPNDHTEELICYALEKQGVPVATALAGIAQSEKTHTAESTLTLAKIAQNNERHTAESATAPTQTPQNKPAAKPVDLGKLQGQAKRLFVLRLLAVCGLVPLSDLSDIFFPGSPAYGRQFLKTLANEGVLEFVKLGKRLAYYLTSQGGEELKKKGKAVAQPFVLPEERLWEHAALTGSISARLCALAARRGVSLNVERETSWQGVRPDLLARWDEGGRACLVAVEADRATESVAAFIKGKLIPYSRALEEYQGGELVRLLVAVPDQNRIAELGEAVMEYPQVAAAVRFAILDDWPVKADVFQEAVFQSTAQRRVGMI
ncbi:MAG: hypothetical protein C4542_08940 [Dehalococcoidia bacterium]|nr:MAG: hypothetical protein C4542_08940 [Dehalococcoidia bacterium]